MSEIRFRKFGIDGDIYTFNHIKFKNLVNSISMHGEKGKLRRTIAERTFKSESTVKDWIKGKSGPNDLDTIYTLEKMFNKPKGYLLQKEKEGEKTMAKEIPEYERNAARELYGEMCELIKSAEYVDEVLLDLTSDTRYAIKGDIEYSAVRSDNERRRVNLIVKIRKAGFDIPNDIRDRLISMVDKIFGPWNIDDGEMYFNSEEYMDYLKTNGIKDDETARYFYSGIFVDELYEELDDIFARYRER